jgi:hypothetical protein
VSTVCVYLDSVLAFRNSHVDTLNETTSLHIPTQTQVISFRDGAVVSDTSPAYGGVIAKGDTGRKGFEYRRE